MIPRRPRSSAHLIGTEGFRCDARSITTTICAGPPGTWHPVLRPRRGLHNPEQCSRTAAETTARDASAQRHTYPVVRRAGASISSQTRGRQTVREPTRRTLRTLRPAAASDTSLNQTARAPTERTIGDTDRTLRRQPLRRIRWDRPVGARDDRDLERRLRSAVAVALSLMIGNWLAVSCQHGVRGD